LNNPVNIKNLVKGLINGDKKAFDGLFNFYYPRLHSFIKKFLKTETDVDDIIQEVFIKLWENRTKINNVETFNSWIFTVTKNIIITLFREKVKQSGYESYVRNIVVQDVGFIDTTLEYNEIREKVEKIINRLPEKRKQIFKLSREQGLSNKEIAAQLEISVKTVEDHMMHSIRFLHKNLESLELITLLYLAIFI
jgi:RNA polymerase sigma-70 factor (ECF subfamily)